MDRNIRKILYRVFCMLSFLVGVYLIVDLKVSGTLDVKMIIVFCLFIVLIFWGIADWKLNSDLIQNQEKELMMYQLYIQPLEELVKEIRASQHDFDNHLNAILNMHLTVDTYDELVRRQLEYIHEVRSDNASRYLSLLRISDKVLAGFLYSKIINSPENVETDVEVRNWKVISGVSEHRLIEMAGVLVDNAYEATAKEGGRPLGSGRVQPVSETVPGGNKPLFRVRLYDETKRWAKARDWLGEGEKTDEEPGRRTGSRTRRNRGRQLHAFYVVYMMRYQGQKHVV